MHAPSRSQRAPRARRSRAGFVAATETALAQLLGADLSALDLVGLMIDGVHFGEHCCVVALGIGLDGTKHPLSLVEGSTENATLVTELIVGLRERGLDVTRPILVVLDGSKALRLVGCGRLADEGIVDSVYSVGIDPATRCVVGGPPVGHPARNDRQRTG